MFPRQRCQGSDVKLRAWSVTQGYLVIGRIGCASHAPSGIGVRWRSSNHWQY